MADRVGWGDGRSKRVAGRPGSDPDRHRRRRGRDDGGRDRPGRARGRRPGRHPRSRPRGARPRRRERIADGLARRAEPIGRRPGGRRRPLDPERGPGPTARPPGPRADLAAASEVIVEAVAEDLELKRRLFAALDAVAVRRPRSWPRTRARCPSRAIASATRRPGRVVGLHFFNPAPLMPLVEVVGAGRRSAARHGGRRDRALVRRWAQDPGPDGGHARLHRQPGEPTVHARGAVRCSRPGSRLRRVDRRGGPGGRLPDGPVRADGPRRDRRQPGRGARDLRGVRLRATLPPVGDPGAARRSGSARPQVRAKASTGTPTTVGGWASPARSRSSPSRSIRPARVSGRCQPVGRSTGGRDARSDGSNGSCWRSSTRPIARVGEGVADPSDVDLALRLGSGPPERTVRAGRRVRRAGRGPGPARIGGVRAGPRFDPAPALVAAAEAPT